MTKPTESAHDLDALIAWLQELGIITEYSPEAADGDDDDPWRADDCRRRWLWEQLLDGVAVCRVLAHYQPSLMTKINLSTSDSLFLRMDNVNRFRAGCEAYWRRNVASSSSPAVPLFTHDQLRDYRHFDRVLSVLYSLMDEFLRETTPPEQESPQVVLDMPTQEPQPATPTSPSSSCDSAVAPAGYTLFAYEACKADELSFDVGEQLLVFKQPEGGWWYGRKVSSDESGWFPANYVQLGAESPTSPSPVSPTSTRAYDDLIRQWARSEREFTYKLQALVTHVFGFLRRENSPINERDFETVFGGQYEVLAFHSQLSARLSALLNTHADDCVDLLREFIQLMKDVATELIPVYSKYGSHNARAVRTLYKYQSNERFNDHIKMAYASRGAVDHRLVLSAAPIVNFTSVLMRPLKRILSYAEFMDELSSAVAAQTPDHHPALRDARNAIVGSLTRVRDAKKQAEYHDLLVDLSARIANWEGPGSLMHYGELLMDGMLRMVKDHEQRERLRYFLLLERVLVGLQKTDSRRPQPRYRVIERVPLIGACTQVTDLPDSSATARDAFRLNVASIDGRPASTLLLVAPSTEAKAKWLKHLRWQLTKNAHMSSSFPALPQDLAGDIRRRGGSYGSLRQLFGARPTGVKADAASAVVSPIDTESGRSWFPRTGSLRQMMYAMASPIRKISTSSDRTQEPSSPTLLFCATTPVIGRRASPARNAPPSPPPKPRELRGGTVTKFVLAPPTLPSTPADAPNVRDLLQTLATVLTSHQEALKRIEALEKELKQLRST